MRAASIVALVVALSVVPAWAGVWTQTNGIVLSDSYIDNSGSTQRCIISFQSTGGTGGIMALTNVRVHVGQSFIGQLLGDLGDVNGDHTGIEDKSVDSYAQNLVAAFNAFEYGGVYNARYDTHTLSHFSTVLNADWDSHWWRIGMVGQDGPPDYQLGVSTPVPVLQIVVPDGVTLGNGLDMWWDTVVTCTGPGQPNTYTGFLVPEPASLGLLAAGAIGLLRPRIGR